MAFFFKPKPRTSPPAQPLITAPTTASIDLGRVLPPEDPAIERRIIEVGTEFLDLARGGKAGVLNAAVWSDKLMDWAMQDEAFKDESEKLIFFGRKLIQTCQGDNIIRGLLIKDKYIIDLDI